MQQALEFLVELTKLIPTDEPPRHHLTAQDGVLVLTVWSNGKWWQFQLEESDFDISSKQLAEGIAESLL